MNLRSALDIAALTNPGMVRSHNEDSVATDNEAGFVILADGMGGYNAGEVASGIAIKTLADGLKEALRAGLPEHGPSPVVKSEVEKANEEIYLTALSQPQYTGMGTTLVCALFHDNRVTVAHVGDSRLYRYRELGAEPAQFKSITRDHSLLQEQIDCGLISREDARLSTNKNLVTRALGVDPTVDVEVHEHEALPGDIYLLCSDGLNDMVHDDDIERALSVHSRNLDVAAQELIQLANNNGGRDNVSVILVRIKCDFAASRSRFAWILAWFKKFSGRTRLSEESAKQTWGG